MYGADTHQQPWQTHFREVSSTRCWKRIDLLFEIVNIPCPCQSNICKYMINMINMSLYRAVHLHILARFMHHIKNNWKRDWQNLVCKTPSDKPGFFQLRFLRTMWDLYYQKTKIKLLNTICLPASLNVISMYSVGSSAVPVLLFIILMDTFLTSAISSDILPVVSITKTSADIWVRPRSLKGM